MKTQEIDGKKYVATTMGDGSILLVPEAPEPRTPVRTPEAGDVWSKGGSDYLLYSDGYQLIGAANPKVKMAKCLSANPWITSNYTYLGKFDEVYCKISDVREALSHEDYDGDSVISSKACCNALGAIAWHKTHESLRKLNIID